MKKEEKKEIKEVKQDKPEEKNKGEAKKEEKLGEVKPEECKAQLLKKGDYTVHVLIEEVRNLFQKDPEKAVFPVVKVSCFNRTQRTIKLKSGASNYVFCEHFYFEKNNLSIEELDSQKVIIEVYDNSSTDRKDYLGVFEMDFAYIYNHKKHTVDNRWMALANPESDDLTKVRGYLKLSTCLLHESDERVELKYKPTDDPNSFCVIPPHVKVQFLQLSIYIIRAEQVPDMDYILKADRVKRDCNGFLTVKYMGTELSTSVVDMDAEIIKWEELISLPVTLPAVTNRLVFQLWDKDKVSSELVGTFEISLDDILKNHYNNFKYINIYGAPVGTSGPMMQKMNSNSEIGSLWKGRVLLKINHQSTDNPNTKCVKIPPKDPLLKEVGKLGRPNQWIFNINIFDAFVLPVDDGLYTIKIAIQDQEKTICQPIKAVKRNIKFDMKTTLQLQTLSDNIKDIGDLFIYLVHDNDNICFQRISAEAFLNNDDIMIIKLLPDPSIGEIKETAFSGLVKLKISITNKNNNFSITSKNLQASVDPKSSIPPNTTTNIKLINDDDNDEEDLIAEQKRRKEALTKKPVVTTKSYMIVANIYMTRYLVAGDTSGTSDLYTVLKIKDQEAKTFVKYDTLNCIWNESLIFSNVELDIDNKSSWPIIFLQIMDKDTFCINDDLIAYNYVWLSDSNFAINSLDRITPKWHQLFLPISNRPQGQILLSFSIIDMQINELITNAPITRIVPDTIIYSAEINVLGLRSLQPLSFLPIKKAFIQFDLNSVNVTGKDENNIKSIKTYPKKSGPNPTINTVLKFDIRLPKENIFMPDLQCSVYDYLLAGMVNQMLGVFLIPLKSIIQENRESIERDMKITESKIAMLLMDQSKKYESQAKSNNIDLMEIAADFSSNGNNLIEIKETGKNNQGYAPLLDDKQDVKIKVDPKDVKLNYNENQEIINSAKKEPEIGNEKSTLIKVPGENVNDPNDINNPQNFVKLPVYKKYIIPGSEKTKNCRHFDKEDESQIPDQEKYVAVGFNKYPGDGKKHYRRFFNGPLEEITELDMKSPFYKFPLKRGKFIDRSEESGIFEALRNQENKIIKRFKLIGGEDVSKNKMIDMEEINIVNDNFFEDKEFGMFKGLIRIVEKDKLNEYENMIETIKKGDSNFLNDFKYLTRFNDLSKRILVEKKVYVRLYILKLGDLAEKDTLSKSDPYLKISIGDKVIDELKNVKEDVTNTDWYKCYDLGAVLPGDPILKIEVWDYDPIFSDELIGYTKIDLEDRFYNDKWIAMKEKPVEKRTLKNPDFENSQGWITLWMEIFENRRDVKTWDITPPPKTELELRMIVWETENIPRGDDEGVSDEYVTCYIDHDNKQSTDMHFRCQGKGSYNWRIVLPVSAPRENTILNVMAMDNDFFSLDDYLSGNSLQLAPLIRDVYDLDVPIKFNEAYWNGLPQTSRGTSEIQFKDKEKFWLKLYKQGPNGIENGGRVLLSLELLPKWKAQICKVGKGREQPNVNPYLPPPIGRFEWSLNPFKMINQCVGPEYRRKIYCLCCCTLLILYLIFVIPYVLLHLAGEAVNPYNYIKMLK